MMPTMTDDQARVIWAALAEALSTHGAGLGGHFDREARFAVATAVHASEAPAVDPQRAAEGRTERRR